MPIAGCCGLAAGEAEHLVHAALLPGATEHEEPLPRQDDAPTPTRKSFRGKPSHLLVILHY